MKMASDQEHPEILYSDKWVTLHSDGTLIIYKYSFPTASPRTLQVARILSISTGTALNLRWWELKVWGILPTWIYWTLDGNRLELQRQGKMDEIRRRSVVIKTDEGFFHNIGLTCENVERFLQEAEKMGVDVITEPAKRK